MSIGNLKDSGNQGNNFPWQLKMLLGQQCACDQLTTLVANTDDVEFLLTSILTTLQAGTEFEAKFVLETCPGAPPTTRVLLEVRIWNTDTSTWEPPQYYLPGSNVPVTIAPGCTLEYTDPTGVLAMIYNELQTQTGILTDIEADTTSIDVTLTNLFAAYSAGQQACASSLSVTLCTEQGTTLSSILTELQGTLDVNVTNPSLQVTQGTSPWAVSLPTGTNTSYYNRIVGAGLVVPAGATSVSVQNIGSDNITITTDSSPATIIDPGVSLTFDAQEGKTLGAYTFANSSGSSLYVVTQVR